jgi:hypothetical protein
MPRSSREPDRSRTTRPDPSAARESHGHPLSTNGDAAHFYRAAQQHHCERLPLVAALRMAMTSDPDFAVAAVDLAALAAVEPAAGPAALHTWERHHIEVVRTAMDGETARAIDLLRDHLSAVGCDPIATTVVLDAARGERLDDLRDELPGCHAPDGAHRAPDD